MILKSRNSLISNDCLNISLNQKSLIYKSIDISNIDNTINYNESIKYIEKYIEYNDLTPKIIIIFIYKSNLSQLKNNIDELTNTLYINYEIIIIHDNEITQLQSLFSNNLFVSIINDNLYDIIKKYNINNNKICLQYENYIHNLYNLDIFYILIL